MTAEERVTRLGVAAEWLAHGGSACVLGHVASAEASWLVVEANYRRTLRVYCGPHLGRPMLSALLDGVERDVLPPGRDRRALDAATSVVPPARLSARRVALAVARLLRALSEEVLLVVEQPQRADRLSLDVLGWLAVARRVPVRVLVVEGLESWPRLVGQRLCPPPALVAVVDAPPGRVIPPDTGPAVPE